MHVANFEPRWIDSRWRLDEPLKRSRQFTSRRWQFVYCSPLAATACSTHIAKILCPSTGVFRDNQNTCELQEGIASSGNNDRDMLYFERHAAVATRLNLLADSWLDAAAPTLVFPRLEGAPLDDWLAGQTQVLSSWTWVPLARRLLQQLAHLHRLGYAHTRLRPEHVWVTSTNQVHLLGLGQCEPIGEYSASLSPVTAYDAPECASAGEVSSAQDIYSAAVVIDELAAGSFVETPIGRCMQAEWPCDRPTASELVELFSCYERELLGRYPVAA